MRAAWIALLLAALVVLLAAVWLGNLGYWANQHGPEQRALYRHMVQTHALDRRERSEVQAALAGGSTVESPRLRAAAVDWARRALARDVELRARHPRESAAVVVLYVVAAGCLAAAGVPLLLDGGTTWTLKLIVALDGTVVARFATRPFARRRNWRRAIERNSDQAPAPRE